MVSVAMRSVARVYIMLQGRTTLPMQLDCPHIATQKTTSLFANSTTATAGPKVEEKQRVAVDRP